MINYLKQLLTKAEEAILELDNEDVKVTSFWHGYCQGIAQAIDLLEPGFLEDYHEDC